MSALPGGGNVGKPSDSTTDLRWLALVADLRSATRGARWDIIPLAVDQQRVQVRAQELRCLTLSALDGIWQKRRHQCTIEDWKLDLVRGSWTITAQAVASSSEPWRGTPSETTPGCAATGGNQLRRMTGRQRWPATARPLLVTAEKLVRKRCPCLPAAQVRPMRDLLVSLLLFKRKSRGSMLPGSTVTLDKKGTVLLSGVSHFSLADLARIAAVLSNTNSGPHWQLHVQCNLSLHNLSFTIQE